MNKNKSIVIALLVLIPLTSRAELKWDLAVYTTYATYAAASLAVLAGAPAIAVGGTIAVGLHAIGLSLYWDDITDPDSANSEQAPKGISVILDPNTPLVVPDGWSAAATGAQEPTPPNTTPTKAHVTTDIPISYTEITDVVHYESEDPTAQDIITWIGEDTLFVIDSIDNAPQNAAFIVLHGHYSDKPTITNFVVNIFRTISCKAGYAQGTDNLCHMTDETLVEKPRDGLCELTKKAGKFEPARNDPDCASSKIAGQGTSTLTATSPGNKSTIAINNDGKVTATSSKFNSTTNKTSTNTGTFSSDNNLTSLQSTEQTGDQTAVDPGTGGGGGGNTTVVNFPNDYSRSGEAQTAANSIIQKLDPLTSMTGEADGSGTDPDFSNGFGSTFDGLTSWTLPPHTSTCPTATFNVWDHTFNLDAQCNVFDQVKAPLSFAMVAAWVILALLIVLGA
ncbi:MAG TPA: hypothetical protein VK974_07185 [Methylophilaceae bacterium]|nr:hypothetical protein [Methylophilaceae bacterium]